MPSTPQRQNGSRMAHSGRCDSAIVPGGACRSPNSVIDSAMIQNDRTGFDQKWSGSIGAPGHQRLMASPRSIIWRATSP